MEKRLLSAFLALFLCVGLLPMQVNAADTDAPPSKDFSQYLTGDPVRKEELTLGGRPFYEVSLEEAIKEIPVLDGTGTVTYVAEFLSRELTEYAACLMGAITNGSTWNYRIVAQQLTGSETLYSLHYNGGDPHTGNVTPFKTELRGLTTGDKMADALGKVGLSAEGAALVAEELINDQTNFDLNTGKTFGSSLLTYGKDEPGDMGVDMPLVRYTVGNVKLELHFLGGKLANVQIELILDEGPEVPSFTDVSADAWYADPVAWAVNKGVTNGATTTTFAPSQDCTHAQILTFLHRAAGKPTASAKAPVTVAASYADAVDWAYEQGMIDGSFDPSAPCTRSQAVNYIWQALGEPDAKASSFTDVPAGASYAKAVDWAVEKGVTNGDGGADTFAPDKVCSRGHIVTFLYRAYSN